MVRPHGLEAAVRARLRPKRSTGTTGAWALYYLGRLLQVSGLVMALFAATAFFGTPSTTAMLKMTLVGVVVFLPGWFLARRDPRER